MKFALLFLSAGTLAAEPALTSLRVEPKERALRGSGASQQMLAVAQYADGSERDVTETATWKLSSPALAELDAHQKLLPKADGRVIVTATLGARTAQSILRVEGVRANRDFDFQLDIGGILTRKGCNGASCHGGVKGRGGLKFSSGALHPKDDYEWIVKGGAYQVLSAEVKGPRQPRINLKEPESSLILQKATGMVAHGGGRRFTKESPEYQAILKWVQNGAPFGKGGDRDNRVVRLEVFPPIVTLEKGGRHRLLVTAHLADGSTEDFTHQALFVSNDKDVATVTEGGVVSAGRLGETAILIRAAGLASSATIGVIGEPVANYPKVTRSNFIDDYIFDKLRKFRVVPSELSSDEEFLRRVCLDLTGTLPPPRRVREFVTLKDPNKREKLVDALMKTPEFVDFWTFRFDDVFRVSVFANGIRPKWSDMYADWVRDSIEKNKPYDQMARERLAAQGYDGPTRHFLPYDVIGPPGETMAEEVRVFFGRRMDCAQCHNHPYEAWSQDQFWGMAAFFGRMFKMGDTGNEYVIFDHPLKEGMGNADVSGDIKLYHPRTKAELKPTLLDGTVPPADDKVNPRKAMAEWMVKHPYFAEAAANRIWGYFFGRGLVDPVDDFRSTNPATHPELLNRLAQEFRSHNHDLRHLMRTIVLSRTYQLSGKPTANNREDRTNYSHSYPRPLEAEVLLDAICDVTGVPEVFTTGVADIANASGQAPAGTRAVALRQPDLFYSRFLDIYGRPNRLTVPERNGKANLGQALNILAGPVYNEKLSAAAGRLQRLMKSSKSDKEIVEEIYLAAFTRLPAPAELQAIEKLIADRGDREEALKDFVWAVLSSREFAENH
ncbi:MAG: DUF1553 domain-containing protein [Bryobacterales bacterium]|nr:DUF1553 domain-containing protein [Bryobacterales bacterium]